MKKIYLLLTILIISFGVSAQDSPCDCGDMATSNDCAGGVYTDFNDANDINNGKGMGGNGDDNGYTPNPTLAFENSGDTYQFCYNYTTQAGETTVGLVNYISSSGLGGSSCNFSRVDWAAYPANDCNSPITGTANGNNAVEFPTQELTEYNFCVTIELDQDCTDGVIDYIENYLYPIASQQPPAGCNADVGTFTIDIDGQNQTGLQHYVEDGQTITITYNNDGTMPPAAGADPTGIGYAIFSCAPTYNTSTQEPSDDGCFIGVSFETNNNIDDSNSGDQSNGMLSAGAGSFTELWFVPITMDDMLSSSKGGVDDDKGQNTFDDLGQKDDCFDVGDAIHVIYETPAAPVADCGDCNNANCPIADVVEFAFRSYQQCTTPLASGSYTQYHTVTTDNNGALGLVQGITVNNGDPLTDVTRNVYLLPVGNCNASQISPNVYNNAGFGSGFNPEWYGLTPNTTYILVIEFTISNGAILAQACADYYGIPNPPQVPGPCEMQNGSINTCDCEFKDSGGDAGSYSANENLTYTICPDDGTSIEMLFQSLDIKNNDLLNIYDGNTATGNPMVALTNTTTAPSLIRATSTNTSGCLTIEFISNGSNHGDWLADVSCFSTCTNPVAAETTVEHGTTKIINVCIGDQVTFDGSTSTHNASSIVSYSWDFDDNGANGSGAQAAHTFTQPGRYVPTLVVENDEGCLSTNAITTEVIVGTVPNFTGTNTATVCEGQQVCIDGVVNFQTLVDAPVVPPTGTLLLPDGAGNTFTTTVDIEGYNIGTTIGSISDIESICLDLEHSAVDDLILTLIAPTGERLVLHNSGGGASALGTPTLDNNAFSATLGCDFGAGTSGAGTPATYCFTPSATAGTLKAVGDANWDMSTNPCYQIPGGDYNAVDPFSNLVGADVNGTWTLQIEDKSGNDDGHLFGWNLTFAPNLLPGTATILPTLASSTWTGADIDNITGQQVCITPTNVNNTDYTFSITDDFGCTYDTTITLTINPSEDASFSYSKSNYCQQEANPTPTVTMSGGAFTVDNANLVFVNTTSGEIDLAGSTPGGPYTVTYNSGGACADQQTFQITITNIDDASFDYPKASYCKSETNPVATNIVTAGGAFSVDNAGLVFADAGTGEIDLIASTSGNYVITYTTAGSCSNSATFNIAITDQDNPTFSYSKASYCISEANPYPTTGPVTPGGTYSTTDPVTVDVSTGEINLTASTIGGPYTITYTTTGSCAATHNVQVTITTLDDASFNYDQTAYCLNSTNPLPQNVMVPGGTYATSDPITIDPSTGEIDLANSIVGGPYTISYTTSGNCAASSTTTVSINQVADPTFTFDNSVYCQDEGSVTPDNIVTTGGSFTELSGAVTIDASTGEIDLLSSTPGGPYIIIYTTAAGCDTIHTFNVTIDGSVIAEFVPTTISVKADAFDLGTLLTLNAATGGTWEGEGTEGSTFNPAPMSDGIYPITYTVTNGTCNDAFTEDITVISDTPPFFPNVFTPDNDGLNDYFYPIGTFEGTTEYKLTIFNRWGEKVFESNDHNETWNGNKPNGNVAISGMYTYHLTYMDSNNEKQARIGSVLLIN